MGARDVIHVVHVEDKTPRNPAQVIVERSCAAALGTGLKSARPRGHVARITQRISPTITLAFVAPHHSKRLS